MLLFLCVCLSVCVADIGLGSSPTSSQSEALPPSTDWPVSAYSSSFSLSSPEMDDAGTRLIHNPLSFYVAVTESLQTGIILSSNMPCNSIQRYLQKWLYERVMRRKPFTQKDFGFYDKVCDKKSNTLHNPKHTIPAWKHSGGSIMQCKLVDQKLNEGKCSAILEENLSSFAKYWRKIYLSIQALLCPKLQLFTGRKKTLMSPLLVKHGFLLDLLSTANFFCSFNLN